jgi:ribosomal protein S27AE
MDVCPRCGESKTLRYHTTWGERLIPCQCGVKVEWIRDKHLVRDATKPRKYKPAKACLLPKYIKDKYEPVKGSIAYEEIFRDER